MASSPYRWVIVAAGGLLGCAAIGAMFSLPVFLKTISQDTGWSVTGVSAAMTIGFLAMAAAAMFWGAMSDRFGPLPVVLTGSILLPAAPAQAAASRLSILTSSGQAAALPLSSDDFRLIRKVPHLVLQ